MEDGEGNSIDNKTSNIPCSPGTETVNIVTAPSTVSFSAATVCDTSILECEKFENDVLKVGVYKHGPTVTFRCANDLSVIEDTQCSRFGNNACFSNSGDNVNVTTEVKSSSSHENQMNLQTVNLQTFLTDAVVPEAQRLNECALVSSNCSCKFQFNCVKEELIPGYSDAASLSNSVPLRMDSRLVDLETTPSYSNRPHKLKSSKDFDLPSDSDSATSLVSRVKNPKKRRTTRVEYRPHARITSYRVRTTVSSTHSRHRLGRTHLGGRIEPGKRRIGLLRPPRLSLRNPGTSRDCKRRSALRTCQRSQLSFATSSSVMNGSCTQWEDVSTNRYQSSREGNLSFSEKVVELLKKQDDFDVEIENIIDLKYGVDMKNNLNYSDEESPGILVSQQYLNNKRRFHDILNSTKVRENSDIHPEDSENLDVFESEGRAHQGTENFNNFEILTAQKNVRKRLHFFPRDNSKSETTSLLRRKRFAECRTKGDDEDENSKFLKSKNEQENITKSASTSATDAFSPPSPNLNVDGSSLSMQGDSFTNQRFSARLRQIQTQKSVFSLNSTVNSFLKNGHHSESKFSCRSPTIPACLFSIYGNGVIASGLNPLQFASDSVTFCENNSTCPLISPEARDDPIIRERYDFAKNKMKKVEDFLETCETMYFGKSVNIRNDPLYMKQSSRSPSNRSSCVRTSRNSMSPFNEIGKVIDPSLLLIRNLIVSNNRLHTESKASHVTSSSCDGKGATKVTQSVFNCQSLSNPNKFTLSTSAKISPLEILSSPLRKPHVLDGWGPKEVCLFEAAICKYGKDFSRIQRIIQTKSTKDMIDFYYLWKKTNRYVAWKEFRCLSETMPVNFFE